MLSNLSIKLVTGNSPNKKQNKKGKKCRAYSNFEISFLPIRTEYFKVNSFVKATLGSHLRYDDDVKTTIPTDVVDVYDEAGAKIQWKQFLGIGFAVDF